MSGKPLMGQRDSLSGLPGTNSFCRVALICLSAMFVVGCGGGGSSPDATAPTAPAPAVTASVDTSLQVPGALSIPTTLAGSQTITMGSPLPTAVSGNGFVVFGLDEHGEIALAGTIDNGAATFSPEGTVLTLGTIVLKSLFPDQSAETHGRRLREASGFSELVTNIRNAALAGRNPLQDVNVQQGFKSTIRQAAEASRPSSSQSRPLAVASRRLVPEDPTILQIPTILGTSEVSLWNIGATGSPSLENIVHLKNTSALNFRAVLLDLSGQPRVEEKLASGADLGVPKSFTGSFNVRLMLDDRANDADYIASVLQVLPLHDNACIDAAVTATASFAFRVTLKQEPLTWLNGLLAFAWPLASECGVWVNPTIQVVKLISSISDAVAFVRLTSELAAVPNTIEDVGVCVNSFHTQISCISEIRVSDLLPMMPSAVQSITIEYFDESGEKTASPPYGLEVDGIDEELFTLSRTEGVAQITSNTANRVGTKTVTLRDPATGTKTEFAVKVTNGKLDKPTYAVAPSSTIELRLVDPDTGSEVIRGATFDIHLPGSTTTYGTFSTQGDTRGPILFRASDVEMPEPLMINLRIDGSDRTGDSGSTIESIAPESQFPRHYSVSVPARDLESPDVYVFAKVSTRTDILVSAGTLFSSDFRYEIDLITRPDGSEFARVTVPAMTLHWQTVDITEPLRDVLDTAMEVPEIVVDVELYPVRKSADGATDTRAMWSGVEFSPGISLPDVFLCPLTQGCDNDLAYISYTAYISGCIGRDGRTSLSLYLDSDASFYDPSDQFIRGAKARWTPAYRPGGIGSPLC